MALEQDIAQWVQKQLEGFSPPSVRGDKVINDPVLGLCAFRRHEINVIDTPIVQRLRCIHQTGMASTVYPTATHTRFEHSLGVATIAEQCALHLSKHHSKHIHDQRISELRMAGLLHDTGHGPFSHISEPYMGNCNGISSELQKEEFQKVDPAELLSYMIVTSKPFMEFVDEKIGELEYAVAMDLRKVGELIIGRVNNPRTEGFLADIVNGPFDADKLDYMKRDAHMTGVKLIIDIDRILYTARIDTRARVGRRLIFEAGGLHSLEQLMFNKLLLYTSIYHHHKIRAAECMVRSVYDRLIDMEDNPLNLDLKNIVSYLDIVDQDIMALSKCKDPIVSDLVTKLMKRDLWKKALVISQYTLDKKSLGKPFYDLMKLRKSPSELLRLRRKICDKVKGEIDIHNLWVDLPEPPKIDEPSYSIVKVTEDEYLTMDKAFQMSVWLERYQTTKWKGHVFCPYNPSLREKVADAAKQVLSSYGIELNENATKLAKAQ